MIELAKQALPFWGLEGASVTLAAHRENVVFHLRHSRGEFALRFHRKQYRTDGELRSELSWIAALDQGGLSML